MDDVSVERGLYDPRDERDACGVGFVAHVKGSASREIVHNALRLLDGLSHRGAVGCDPHTGDGAGILLQIPHAFLKREADFARIRKELADLGETQEPLEAVTLASERALHSPPATIPHQSDSFAI